MMHESIQRMVRRVAADHGGRTAIECGGVALTYREVEAQAGALTSHLLLQEMARGSVVGLLTAGSGRLVSAILGVLDAGGIFLPLDPRVPAKRLAAMTAEASPSWLLVDRDLAGLAAEIAPDTGTRILLFDEAEEMSALPYPERPEPGGEDPCYIYFTSGSTGRPKGVTGRLKAIDHFIRWEIETFELAHGPRVSQLTAPSFDAFLRDAFVPLCSGGTLCVPPGRDILGDAGKLVDWIDGQAIELVHCVPSLLRAILSEDLTPDRFSSLRYVLLAGEPLLPLDVERWTSVFGRRIELVNLYGPSETTMVKLFHRVQPEDAQRRTIPIGKPMRGARGLILDARGKPRPAGAIGEIYIRTPYRSLGYYNRPEETSQVFLRNPLSEDPNDLLYRTGDLGRVLEDGSFEFLGRKDQQVKIRGLRVELEEIEVLLLQHEAVREAAVVDQQDGQGSLFLAGFVVLRPGGDAELLRDHLAALLPEAMVPSRLLAVDELPRSINGKIDRRALRELAQARSGTAGEHVEPRNELEALLAGLFSQLLGTQRTGIHDNFFQLGGHSLLATQLVARVRHALALEVPLRSLLQHPTVAGLAEEIEMLRRTASAPAGVPPLVPVARGADLPLSFAQQRLWFLSELEPGSPAYNMPAGLRLTGRLDVRALRETFREIVRRHESLRTVFAAAGGVPRQIVQPDGAAELPVIDLSGLPSRQREGCLSSEVAAAFWRPFGLARGPLVRAQLLKLADEEHAVVFCMHHIISDAWSVGLLIREVSAIYGALIRGQASPLPPLPVQYADFAQWQRSWLQGEILERQIASWKERLAGAVPLALPTDRSAAGRRPARGIQELSLPPELTARLRELGRGAEATLFMVVLAGLKALLHRLSGQRDTSVGVPVANRTRLELEGVIGFFVNTLVLRTRVGPEATFHDLLREVRAAAIEAQAHQDLPFERLIEELDPERHLDQTPLFRVMFDLAAAPPQEITLPGLRTGPLSDGRGGEAKLDLVLHLQELGGLLTGFFEYRTTLFEPTTIQRLTAWLTSLLAAVAAEPGRRLAEAPMLTEAELHQALVERNEGRRDTTADGLFPEMFAAQARRSPEAAALVFDAGNGPGRMTYHDLAARADRLARFLTGLGVGPGVLTAVCMDRSPLLIEALLGILQAGGGYVPLEPDLPRERIEILLEESGARLLLTRESLRSRLPDRVPVICLDRDAERIAGAVRGEPGNAPSPHDPAYVMFTSGSTGLPKGVVVPHRALAWYIRTSIDQYEVQPADRVLQISSVAFDISVEEIFSPLARGATLCLCSDPLLRSPGFFLEKSREWGVTMWSPPTAFWHALVDEIAAGRAEVPSTLRLVVIGGESASPAHLAVWRARVGSAVRLVNCYGPTETTVSATLRDLCDPAAGADLAPVPIGRPIRGAEIHVLDEALQPVPAGVPGEAYLGGAGCARGYLGRPGLTAERFVPHPFAGEPGERLYRTGDLVRSLPDGDLEFVGRTDHQVKIRGFRVEPGEVDAVLASHPRVQTSITIPWEPAPGDRRLATWFVARPGEAPPLSELRSFLQSRLPSYLVPAALEPLASLPQTPSGKVDRRALPAPQSARAVAESYVAPSGPAEELLAGIWAEVLRLDRIGALDNFFALGGHSLLATQVVSRVRQVLGVELPLRRIFEAPTVRELALRLRGEAKPGGGSAPIQPSGKEGPAPLSFAQQRLWFLDQLAPGNPAYNISSAVRIAGALSVEALEKAFAEVVRRHAALRTVFTVEAGQPVQVIAPPDDARPELRVLDLSDAPEAAREEWAVELAREEARHPFDLRNGPLLRLNLLRLAEHEHLLLINLHHIVSDAWSMDVLVREMGILYPAFARGEPSPLAEPPLQYADFAGWQRGWLQGEVLDEQLAYWKAKLAGAPTLLELPTDRPRPAVQTYRGAAVGRTLPPSLSTAVRDLCRKEGVTPFMLLLAGWAVLLGRYARQEDVLVGSPIAGRSRREIEDLIGFFVNTLVLRTGLAGSPSFRHLLGCVRETALDAFAHQDLPFELLVEELAVERSLAHNPLIQVMLTFQNGAAGELRIPGLELSPANGPGTTAKLDLGLTFVETGEGFAGSLEHATDLFDRTTAERFLDHLANLLTSAVEAPGRPVSELRLMEAAEERQLLTGLNRAGRTWALPVAVQDLFTRQADRIPDKTAAVGARGALSFGMLDERSTALAARIRSVLAGPPLDRRIGLLADHEPGVLIGMLGILKADAGFVPIDLRHPNERLAGILEDAACEVLVAGRDHLERAEHLISGLVRPCTLLCLDGGGVAGAADAAEHRDPGALRALAYAVYTSGSTGRPKGVQVSHESLVPMLLWGCDHFGLGGHTRALQSLSYCFDFGIFEHLVTVIAGGTLVYPGEAAGDPDAFAREIARHGIDTLHTTPAFARELARSVGTSRILESLEILHLGGEALSWSTVERLREAAPRAALFNGYGPTEATINSSIFRIGGDDAAWPVVPIGRRSADNALYVLDSAGLPAPPGARGELHVGGIGVARGYLGLPGATAERFVPDPFGAAPGGRLYRTGDLVRHLSGGERPDGERPDGDRPGGDLEFLGRIDHQVKIRGFRIELEEIEAVLRSHPAVSACASLVRTDVPDDPRLVAYAVLDPAGWFDPADPGPALSAWLRGKLPEYMLPAFLVLLDALPLTANGKVDRKALPAPERRTEESIYAAPGDAVEEGLTDIWQEVLQLDRIGIHDNFFALGGHSLLATQVVTRMREKLGIHLPLRRVFEAPTIHQLSRSLRDGCAAGKQD